jgi:hypothetical protein
MSNRGLRLDHILASPGLRDAAIIDGKVSSKVHDTVREWERPSDHAPVTADLKRPSEIEIRPILDMSDFAEVMTPELEALHQRTRDRLAGG